MQSAGEAPRPPALMQCCYRRRLAPELQESQPHTCVLLQLSHSGLTPAAQQLLQAARPVKVTTPPISRQQPS